jgi:hypothetical protein
VMLEARCSWWRGDVDGTMVVVEGKN